MITMPILDDDVIRMGPIVIWLDEIIEIKMGLDWLKKSLDNQYQTSTIFMWDNVYSMIWGNCFSYKSYFILVIISKEDHSCVFEIWLFWTSVIGGWTLLTGIISSFVQIYIRQCARSVLFKCVNQYILQL